ncbi:hypothetical protein D3C72_2100330 [compost metagenome]
MDCRFIAILAILLQLHAVRIIPLVLVGRIVPLFAVRASQSNDNPHVYTSHRQPELIKNPDCLGLAS